MLARDKGGYRPAEVRIGREAKGRTEVLAGLAPGEKVVVSGQFLLDSEASLAGLDVRAIAEAPTGARASTERREGEERPAAYSAIGTITAITARSVTVRHGPVPALEWPAMTMSFAAEGPAQLRGFKLGERVRFSFVQSAGGPRIVSIRQAPQ